MTFDLGIYPGGLLGSDTGLVHPRLPDDPARITAALRELQGPAPGLLVRAYLPFTGPDAGSGPATPAEPDRLLGGGRRLDLVLPFRAATGCLEGWPDFVRTAVRSYGPALAHVQICEEPNLDLPPVDGSIPNVRAALTAGVVAAKEEIRAQGLDARVGFNAVPSFDPADDFWPDLGARADAAFHDALDWVGLDFFPDVFRPVDPADLSGAVEAVLRHFRRTSLPQAGIGAGMPVRICENGWPTGPERTERRQAEVVEEVVRTAHRLRGDLHLTGYTLFSLRDADSTGTGLFDRFGLLRDDYSPKPAFDTYRRLIAELGT
ncbi:hypothetical protein [Kitasatospora sp. NPDC059571]|uniref:hypothetical protein n=1 Tax=Kitasatospora sp. NPDC059571 TaxID=3346871 RepID=UPI0036BB44B1